MITLEKIKIYAKYGGDSDHLARLNNQKDIQLINDDWSLIDGFITDIFLVERNLTSEEFEEKLKARLLQQSDNEMTILELKELSKRFY